MKYCKWSKHCPPLNKTLLRISPGWEGGEGVGVLKGNLGRGVPPRLANPDPV